MRRESSTVVVLAGEVGDALLTGLGRSPNVSVARAPAAGPGQPAAEQPTAARPGWEAGALAMREAGALAMREAAAGDAGGGRRRSTYVIVPDDPLADVAAAWRAMWEVAGGPHAAAGFEQRAADALAAWRDKRFELPDYYLVMAGAQPGGTGPDLYLGPLRAARGRGQDAQPQHTLLFPTPGRRCCDGIDAPSGAHCAPGGGRLASTELAGGLVPRGRNRLATR